MSTPSPSSRPDSPGEALVQVLTETYALFCQAQSCQGSIEGEDFASLRMEFEAQSQDLFQAIDQLAERLRGLGGDAPAGLADLGRLGNVRDASPAPDAQAMVGELLEAHKALCETLRRALRVAADAGDDVSAGMLANRLAAHDKTLWMLRVHLAG